MRDREEIHDRIEQLEERYDQYDPPSSPVEEEHEVAILRAIEELEWVLEERSTTDSFTK